MDLNKYINICPRKINPPKPKYGYFKKMNLDPRLLKNIKFTKPTPIQRKSIPVILNSSEMIGISQTGSGKTLAYLIPIIQKAIEGKRSLIVVPTKELKLQVENIRNELSTGIDFKNREDLNLNKTNKNKKFNDIDGTEMLKHYLNSHPVTVTTPGQIRNMIKKFDIVVLDEMDILIENFYNDLIFINNDKQILENIEMLKSNNLKGIVKNNPRKDDFNLNNIQLIGFSATLPDKVTNLFSNPEIIKESEGLSENLTSYFFYLRENKDQFLIFLLKKINKALIFASNKYTAKYLEEMINESSILKLSFKEELKSENNKIIAQSLYSSLDNECRDEIYKNFINNKIKFLIVTDIAARGLHIQDLEILINYDMADDKIFLHRVGRVARNRKGIVFSFITSNDINHYQEIKEKNYKNKECILYDTPNLNYKIQNNSLKEIGIKAYKKSLKFRKKVNKNISISEILKNLEEFDFNILNDIIFSKVKKILKNDKKELIDKIKNYGQNFNENKKMENDENKNLKYRDQFYIPYKNEKLNSLHSSINSLPKDN